MMNGREHGVLVGYDGSPVSKVALDWAAETARQQGKRLTVLFCVDLAMMPAFPAYDAAVALPDLEQAARAVLDEGAERAAAIVGRDGVQPLTAIGSSAAELVAASKDADIVVTGSRGRGRLLAGLLGSTSYAVTAHAHCPAVVVRPGQGDDVGVVGVGERVPHPDAEHAVIVGLDDSDASERALEMGAEVAAAAGATLRLVTVARVGSIESWAYAEDTQAGTDETHEVREAAEDTLRRSEAHARGAHPELTIETEVLYGEPGHVLGDLAAHAGLVVVGSRGRGGFAGLLLGSVSHTVIHEAPCPVMVVR
jgi:nucleotide-binding universal stress UspA family protein